MTTFFWVMSIITVLANIISHWSLSKGWVHITYPINVVVYSCYIIVETVLALNDPSQVGVILFNVVNIWALIMAAKGIIRLRRKTGKKQFVENIQDAKS